MPKLMKNIEKILPSCWENDQRIGVLFAPFRPRNVNPESYDFKMKFWQNLIEAFCEHKGEAFFNLSELLDNFQRKGLKVKCLDTVLENLIKNNEARERTEFEEELFNSRFQWIFNCTIKRPLYWSLNIFKEIIGLSIRDRWKQCHYVHLKVMHKLSEKLIAELLEKGTGQVFLYSEFKSLGCTVIPGLTEEGLDLCLLQLKSQGLLEVEKLFVDTEDETKVIKIAGNSKNGKVKKETNLVEVDRLRVIWKIQDAKLQRLMQDIQVQSIDLQRNLKENKREIAKDHLRKKKMLEKKFEKCSVALQNIENLISDIEEAQSQHIILEAYKTGSKALKEALNCVQVEDIIADMKEAMQDQQEISNRIATTTEEVNGNEIEAQLEAELNEMLKTEDKTKEVDSELLEMVQQLEVVSYKMETKETKKSILNES